MYDKIKNNEKSFFHLLFVLDKIFKDNDIDYWLVYGSLIGAIREGTYIKWDKDMDIAIHIKNAKQVLNLKNVFASYGIELNGFIRMHVKKGNASICIFPLYTIKKKNRYYIVQCHNLLYSIINKLFRKKLNSMFKKSCIYWYLCSKIKTIETIHSHLDSLGNFSYIEFCNTVCPIPEYPDKYLTYMFGDWRTPHKFYSHADIGNMYNVRRYK